MEDLTKLSKKQLIDLLQGSEPAQEDSRVRELESALISVNNRAQAAKKLAEQAADDTVYEVRLVKDLSFSVFPRDRRGDVVRFNFPKKGAVHYMTAAQIFEVKTDYPWVFDDGYLVAPDVVEPSANAIEDYDEFLSAIPYDEIVPRLEEIRAPDVLRALYHHIDGLRFEVTEEGVVRREIDGKLGVIQHALAERFRTLSGIRLAADPTP